MCFASPSIPRATPAPAPVVGPDDPSVQAAMDSERRRRAEAMGRASTILTGPGGVTAPASYAPKTLLGS